jgi:spermidine/putrescine ABC transporter ATP-binding subunit
VSVEPTVRAAETAARRGPTDVISIEGVVKDYGSVRALDHVSLTIHENEFFALLGPSGCGKTTLLRCIGGFEEVSDGRILLDGRDLVGTRPYARPVNMMFQSYALFPHMNVRDNVAYGLRAERLPADEIAQRVREVLSTVGMDAMADRRPHQLSGGQRQRVALARAIVKRPRVLLLDEPLAALDRKMRQEMEFELKRLQHEVGITFIVVTHDQEEAMTMADRIAVMDGGHILQVASPHELYDRPADRFVAAFIGKMNFLEGTVTRGGVEVSSHGILPADVGAFEDGATVALAVRPEAAEIRSDDDERGPAGGVVVLDAVVEAVAFVGSQVRTYLVLEGSGLPFVAVGSPRDGASQAGRSVRITWPTSAMRVLPA